MKLNFGCGAIYKDGWVNADIDLKVKADVYLDVNQTNLPWSNNSFDYILADNVIEHLPEDKVRYLLHEFNRILVPGGKLEIYVPHFTGILTKYLGHYRGYGVNSLCDERDIFSVVKEEILPISRCSTAGYKWLRWLNWFKFLFNCSRGWQQICEKFTWGGFEEIHYILEAKK
jgi:predicted SAM-dependent methyltransferase